MVTTTTKTLNYSITKGNQTNSVNATITSTPGFNSNYLGKIPGILKILELLLAAIGLGLIASLRGEKRLVTEIRVAGNPVNYPGIPLDSNYKDYLTERYLAGEIYYLVAHGAVLTFLFIILVAYLFHTTSAMIIPKATTLENVANLTLALLLLAAGITVIVLTEIWKYDPDYPNANRPLQAPPAQTYNQEPVRLAAGAIAILNGLLFIASFVLSRKELAGPKTL